MTRHDASARFSSMTGSSTDSARSSITVKPLPLTPTSASSPGLGITTANVSRSTSTSHGSRRAAPSRLKTDENGQLLRSLKDSDGQISPTSNSTSRLALSPASANSTTSIREHRMSDLADYRRDLSILEPGGGRAPRNQQNNPATGSLSQVAPWMASSSPTPSSVGPMATTFYNDSTDNLSLSSQLSPSIPSTARPSQTTTGSTESPDAAYFTDERRPSIASITTTASSQGSRASGTRGGFRKLQGFFGEEFPGRDSSEISLVHPAQGKEHRSHSYSRPHRDRNYSNATDHGREASPHSRPRTPVPAPDVVPFLYQEKEDIARYGEAPVRDILSGPDRDRYITDATVQNPPKTSSSGRSGHSIVHLPGHGHHRHNKSNEDPRSLRPSISREDTGPLTAKERNGSAVMYGSVSRSQSPAPSGGSSTVHAASKNGSVDGQTSPGHHKKGFLGRLRRHRDKDDGSDLKKLPSSSVSLQSRPSRQELPRADGLPPPVPSEWPGTPDYRENAYGLMRPTQTSRQATFNNKFPFAKKNRTPRHHDDIDEHIGPTDRQQGESTAFYLDTNLDNMDGILKRPLPLTPMDAQFVHDIDPDRSFAKPSAAVNAATAVAAAAASLGSATGLEFDVKDGNNTWDAPESWAVKRGDEPSTHTPEADDIGSPPRPEEKRSQYCIRIFRSDGTFATLQMSLDAQVKDVIAQIFKKSYGNGSSKAESYSIVLKKRDLMRVLQETERPLLMQKRLLQQIGYDERDRIEDLGREDNSYLCRFVFISNREAEFHRTTHDSGFGRMAKFNHIDLSGRNLLTIPVPLYSKAGEIISLNLSKNLSLRVPTDFIQSCVNLRDIKFNYNESRSLPPSIGRASRLTYLDASNNRLEQLDTPDLSGINSLLKLNLANNRLKHLPAYLGAYRMLRTLNISSNFLEKFPGFLCDLESLVDLDLSFNLIAAFPEQVGRLRSLEKLVITNNRLTGALPLAFRDLSSLRELDIKYNSITSIEVISELPKLEIFSADHNQISQFSGTLERIRSFRLNSNPISKFEIKGPVPTLKILNLSNAQLASIDEAFLYMPNLERLALDKNYFASLPNRLGFLVRLEHFTIADNNLGELPPEIGCLGELRVLDVRGNNLRKLPMELWWANKLETLNASSNILEGFPKPASRPPQPPSADSTTNLGSLTGKTLVVGGLSQTPSAEELSGDASRRPSQASSSTLLSVGPPPVGNGDRKGSLVSVYGRGGRKASVMSRSTTSTSQSSQSTLSAATAIPPPAPRKDSGHSQRFMLSTFAQSLRYLFLADNHLDDEVFDMIAPCRELRIINLSYNEIGDMPQRCLKNFGSLMELYLSGNELTSLPTDDLGDGCLQTLHVNGNKFTNLPADISKARKLAVLDCSNNSLKYNIANVTFDWHWSLNPNLRYLNLSGNRRLEIKPPATGALVPNREQYTDFSRLVNLRVLGLMDVTLINPSIPDQSEDCRVRTSASMAGPLKYGMADTLGKYEHLSTADLVVPRFNSSDMEMLLGLFDGQALSSGGSKIAKYLHEHFGHIFASELKLLPKRGGETPADALRRAFLALNKDLVTAAAQNAEERPLTAHRGSQAAVVLSREDINSGGVATVLYLSKEDLYVANVGDVQAMLIRTDGTIKMLTKKHDPAEPAERSRIRDAGGWVSRSGRLNDLLEVSRAFGYVDLMPAVQAAPHVSHTTLRDHDEMVVVATRELWEYLDTSLVADFVRAERSDPMRAAQRLRDMAMAYGSSSKIMVMILSVADLKQRNERWRLQRGQSMSLEGMPLQEEIHSKAPRRIKKTKAEAPLDSTLQRLGQEVKPPTGVISIVFTDIKNSTQLWETYPEAMRSAIRLHNELMRRQLRQIGGYEVKTEGDAFMVSFPTATSALLWCFTVQSALLTVEWPPGLLQSPSCRPQYDRDKKLIFNGLSVRMGIHWGEPLAEQDPVTHRMDYYGPMVNKASRISAVADGGQISVSSDFIMEIQRCLEQYQELSSVPEDSLEDDDDFSKAIRSELRLLSSQGFEVKDLGERKLKGLENPEVVYSLYPHALASRIETHVQHERNQQAIGSPAVDKPAMLSPDSQLEIDPEEVWGLWRVALRLEMLCSSLEAPGGNLQAPETELLERMKAKGGEVTEAFLVKFMEHQVSRIETCINTLAIRRMAVGDRAVHQLAELQAPMSAVLGSIGKQLALLTRYKAIYGELPEEDVLDGSIPDPAPRPAGQNWPWDR